MTTLYGIKNCDTIKKARKWLEAHGVDYRFHDFRADGLDEKRLRGWVKQVGWETLLNRRGTTWRKLPDSQRESVDEASAVALMLEQPALIKRPVLEQGKDVCVGFKEADYAARFR
jgi:arsenate reductase (glutaredoxin)